MIYYYDIAVKYTIGGREVIKVYKKNFLEVADFFIWLKDKHKDNYTLMSIKEHRQYGRKFQKIWFEEFESKGR